MSDLLEDQKIHYIVKDYRRMYNQHEELVKELKKLQDEALHKDNRIRDLERQVENLKNQIPPEPPAPKIPKALEKKLKHYLAEIEMPIDSTITKLEKRIVALNTAADYMQRLRDVLENKVLEQ